MINLPRPLITNLMTSPLDFFRLIDELPLGVLILDTNRRVVFLNRVFEALSGFSPSMAYGVQCYNILRGAAPYAIAYDSGQFTTGEFFKYGIPASVLLMIVIAIAVFFIWPIMGMPILIN